MSKFKPEGQLISEKSNKEFLSSLSSLKEAYHLGAILESRVLLCDREHNLKVDLGCTYGIIPHNEGALGIDDGSVLDGSNDFHKRFLEDIVGEIFVTYNAYYVIVQTCLMPTQQDIKGLIVPGGKC